MIAGTAGVRDIIEKHEWAGREQSASFQIQKGFFLTEKNSIWL